MDGILVLEDGRFYRGRLFGAGRHGGGEVVFNTSPFGYQEIISDPSYAGQIVILTTAHVGNYGVNAEDAESARPRAAGLLVRDYHPTPSNWRADRSLESYLCEAGIPAMSGVDTRSLVLHLRRRGALRGVIAPLPEGCQAVPLAGWTDGCEALRDLAVQAQSLPKMEGRDLAGEVTCASAYSLGDPQAAFHVVAVDFGIKRNILHQLVNVGCRLTVVPSTVTAADVLALGPDGLLLSNGPGDPEPLTHAVEMIRGLLERLPIFGICLGHQLLGLACGGSTYKMHFGHHGGNHPVRDLETGRVEITAQNHGFAIASSSLDGRQVRVTHTNLNDDSVEGLRHRRLPVFSVQFHPEASPGPHDSHHLFRRFLTLMERAR